MEESSRCRGTIVALVTPFTEDTGKVSFKALEKLLAFHIRSSTGAVVVNGTTGESATLSDEEQLELIRETVRICKGSGIKVIAGTGSNCTKKAVSLTRFAQEVGVDSALVVTPYYNRPSPKGLVSYYNEIDRVGLPFYVYNVPGRTGVNVSPETMREIVASCGNVVGLKATNGLLEEIARVALECEEIHPGFEIFSGDDGLIVPILSIGGIGAISVVGNIMPDIVSDAIQSFQQGNIERAAYLQRYLVGFSHMVMRTQASPAATKATLRHMGFEVGGTRSPLVDLSPQESELVYMAYLKVKDICS